MITTFERLAKVLKGEAPAANWIERAFAALASAVSSISAVTYNDRGKFLGVNTSNNNLGWKAIRQVPAVENADKGKYLHANDDTGNLEWSEANGDLFYIVNVTPSGGTATLDKSYSELFAIYKNGQIPVLSAGGDLYFPQTLPMAEGDQFEWVGESYSPGVTSWNLSVIYIVLGSNDSVLVEMLNTELTPSNN